jgi:hypothetical protein
MSCKYWVRVRVSPYPVTIFRMVRKGRSEVGASHLDMLIIIRMQGDRASGSKLIKSQFVWAEWEGSAEGMSTNEYLLVVSIP